MKFVHSTAVAAIALLMAASGASAAPRTATLQIENVTCVTCAPIVKKVLSRMPGVSQVAVVERAGTATATVTFDDGKVTAEALAQAITNAGFPSNVTGVTNAAAPAATGSAALGC